MSEEERSQHSQTLNSDSPTGSKPTITIADIIPPAPKGPPPGRGPTPPPIETILEEEEPLVSPRPNNGEEDSGTMVKSGSYTVLNSTMGEKPSIPAKDAAFQPKSNGTCVCVCAYTRARACVRVCDAPTFQ